MMIIVYFTHVITWRCWPCCGWTIHLVCYSFHNNASSLTFDYECYLFLWITQQFIFFMHWLRFRLLKESETNLLFPKVKELSLTNLETSVEVMFFRQMNFFHLKIFSFYKLFEPTFLQLFFLYFFCVAPTNNFLLKWLFTEAKQGNLPENYKKQVFNWCYCLTGYFDKIVKFNSFDFWTAWVRQNRKYVLWINFKRIL